MLHNAGEALSLREGIRRGFNRAAAKFHFIDLVMLSEEFSPKSARNAASLLLPAFDPNSPCFVDLLLTRRAGMQKPRDKAGRKSLIYFSNLVAGTGFEPVTFRL